MRLKGTNLEWLAGRPVVVLSEVTSKKLNVHVNDRIKLSYNKKKIYAVVDIFTSLIQHNEIGLSREISAYLGHRQGNFIEVSTPEVSEGAKIIRKKMRGETLTRREIEQIVIDITDNNLTESEIAYFVSAEKIKGMSIKEIFYLTSAMVTSGKNLKFHEKIIADKHCIGGIAGNRTTPIVVAICAAAGLKMPKSSSRAITSASGTADVVETIADVELSTKEIKAVVEKVGACLVWGGSLGLAPSDDKIIKIERILNLDVEPQLIASILAKKIAAGSNHIIIDIPYGSGKIKTKFRARKLGKKFKKISQMFGLKLKPVYTRGDKPIGKGFGPVLEMLDVISVLKNEASCSKELKLKSLYLASKLMSLCGIYFSYKKAKKILESGKALEKFKEIINAQNKSNDFELRTKKLKPAKLSKIMRAEKSGRLLFITNEDLNSICRVLGTPETVDAGVYMHILEGKVNKGDKLLTLYSESATRLNEAYKSISRNKMLKIQ